MELKKLAPWNWFKKEEEMEHTVPVVHGKGLPYNGRHHDPLVQIHRDIDQIFDRFFQGFSLPTPAGWPSFSSFEGSGILRPRVDLSAGEKEYLLTVEIPGVSEKDVSLSITAGTMTIKGEKKLEKEEREKDYYRMERSYGSFQRILSLPEDVEQDAIRAGFKDGVLTVTMPRKPMAKGEVKQIAIKNET